MNPALRADVSGAFENLPDCGIILLGDRNYLETPRLELGRGKMSMAPISAMTKRWDRLMRLQVDFILPLELVYFFGSEDWSAARRVLDLGTGNGYYLSRLSDYFSSKHYTGLDINPEYISIASRELGKSLDAKFGVRSAFDLDPQQDGTFDFVIARALVQHLDDTDRFLDRSRGVLNPGGSLLIIDADDPARKFVPDLPLISNLFDEIRAVNRTRGHTREVAGLMNRNAEDHGFRKTYEQRIIIPTTIRGHKELCYNIYISILNVIKEDYGIDLDYNLLREELQSWFEIPNSYAQTGVLMMCFRRA